VLLFFLWWVVAQKVLCIIKPFYQQEDLHLFQQNNYEQYLLRTSKTAVVSSSNNLFSLLSKNVLKGNIYMHFFSTAVYMSSHRQNAWYILYILNSKPFMYITAMKILFNA